MRELVMLCYGVLKNRTPFDPWWKSLTNRRPGVAAGQ
jgi:hypothetical protein